MITKKGYPASLLLHFRYAEGRLTVDVPVTERAGLEAAFNPPTGALVESDWRHDIPLFIAAEVKAKASATLKKHMERIALHQEQLIAAISDLLTTYDGVLHPRSRTTNEQAAATAVDKAKVEWQAEQRRSQVAFLSTLPGKTLADIARSLSVDTVGLTLPELVEQIVEAQSVPA